MLTKGGAKLMDFGLARAVSVAAASGTLTESPTVSRPLTAEGTIVGTFQYMAPEQLEGKEADARTDLWALGCVLYEMATGKRAFAGESQASLIVAIMEREPPAITTLQPLAPPALERIVRRCLEKDPDERWQNARDLMHELKWIAKAGSQAGVPAPAAAARTRRGRLLLSFVALLCLALGVVIGAAVQGWLAGSRPVSSSPKTFQQYPIFRARFEPDGQGIVFSAAPEGNTPELFSVRPEFMAPRPLGLRGVHLLAASSSGELAVLTRARYLGHMLFSGTLARLRLGAEEPREVLENVRDADWSPDGSGLAIIREVGGRDRLEYPAGKVLCESGGYLSDLRFSPRGDRIAFFDHPAKYDDRGAVKVVDLAGRATKLSGGYSSLEGLAWSSDGKQVYFCGAAAGFDFPVFALTLSGSRRVAHESAGALRILDVSRRGRWLVASDDDRSGIMVRPPGGDSERALSWLNYSVLPSLSGDGRTLLFTEQGGQNNPNSSVCLRRTDGSPVVRLGEGGGGRLSPDGKWALAAILISPMQLVLYPTGAGETVRLPRGNLEACEDEAWLPDGRRILVCGVEPGHGPRVYVQEIPSGSPRAITPEGTHLGAVSPDGRLVLSSTSDGSWTLYPVEGGTPQPVPGLTVEDRVVRWSADGTSLYVCNSHEVPSRVERFTLASGRRDSVMELGTENRTGLVLIRSVSMADDPRVYAYSPRRILSGLFVVEGAR
jgi:Tol biopolymer transport system component